MNNKYKIIIGTPLLRPGLSIETNVSKNYVIDATKELMNLVRDINQKDNKDYQKHIVNPIEPITFQKHKHKENKIIIRHLIGKKCSVKILDFNCNYHMNKFLRFVCEIPEFNFSFTVISVDDIINYGSKLIKRKLHSGKLRLNDYGDEVEYFKCDDYYSCHIKNKNITYCVMTFDLIKSTGIKMLKNTPKSIIIHYEDEKYECFYEDDDEDDDEDSFVCEIPELDIKFNLNLKKNDIYSCGLHLIKERLVNNNNNNINIFYHDKYYKCNYTRNSDGTFDCNLIDFDIPFVSTVFTDIKSTGLIILKQHVPLIYPINFNGITIDCEYYELDGNYICNIKEYEINYHTKELSDIPTKGYKLLNNHLNMLDGENYIKIKHRNEEIKIHFKRNVYSGLIECFIKDYGIEYSVTNMNDIQIVGKENFIKFLNNNNIISHDYKGIQINIRYTPSIFSNYFCEILNFDFKYNSKLGHLFYDAIKTIDKNNLI